MALKKLTNITPAELKAKGVVALGDKPNLASSYGVGGLSPTNLKLWFDQIGQLLSEKLNIIQDTLSGNDAASYIRLNLQGLDSSKEELEGFIYSLQDLCESFRNGSFANYLLLLESAGDNKTKTIQSIVFNFTQKMSTFAERLSDVENLSTNAATEAASAKNTAQEALNTIVEQLGTLVYYNGVFQRQIDVKQFATKDDLAEKVAELVNSAPDTLNTLGELADAIQNNVSVINAIENAIAYKVSKVEGKDLSSNDYTTEEKTKFNNTIEKENQITLANNVKIYSEKDDSGEVSFVIEFPEEV